jgi:hypothetical protein
MSTDEIVASFLLHRYAARALANRKHAPRKPSIGLEAFNNLLNTEELNLLEASLKQHKQ